MLNFYRIRAWHGATLSVSVPAGFLVAGEHSVQGNEHRQVLATVPDCRPDLCLLSALSSPRVGIALGPRDYRAAVLPVLLIPQGGGGRVALVHPITRRALCAPPPRSQQKPPAVFADRTVISDWEMFELVPLAPTAIPPDSGDWTGPLERLLENGNLVDSVLYLLGHATAHQVEAVLDCACALLGMHDLAHLAECLLAAPSLLARLAALVPNDVWTSHALPRLAAWVANREAEPIALTRYHIGPELDYLAEAGFRGAFASFGHAVTAYARASVTPRRDICVVSTARNEGIYLLEWLAWHRSIGIAHFFLYSNDNNDGSDELLGHLADAGIITWIANRLNPGSLAQPKAYAHALGVLPDVLDYRWALVIDLDEFFVPNPALFDSAAAFAKWHDMRETDAVALNWILVGSGGETAWRDVPVTRRFRRLQRGTNAHVKSMCRPARFIHSHPHFPITDDRRAFVYRSANGNLHTWRNATATQGDLAPAFSDQPDADHACIYHYFYKSAEEFLWKFMRNRGDAPNASGLSVDLINPEFFHAFVDQHDAQDFVPEQRMAYWAPAFEAEMARLLALPGVAAANARAQANFRALMARAKATSLSRADSEPSQPLFRLASLGRASPQ